MSTNKHIDIICVLVLVFAIIVTVIMMNGTALGITSIVDQDAESQEDDSQFTDNDLKDVWDFKKITEIDLDEISDGSQGSISGTGAYYYNNTLVITDAGHYSLSGNLSGSVVIDANDGDKVWIRLNDANITCTDDACIKILSADKVFLSLAENTGNTLTTLSENITSNVDSSTSDSDSSTSYSDESSSDNAKAALYSKEDLTINGSGKLTIVSESGHGIKANDDLTITGGTIDISAPSDGIHVNDSLKITKAEIKCTALDDSLHADKSIYIASGKITISGCYEGIESDTIEIDGGEISISCSDDGLNAESLITINGGVIYVSNSNGRDADGFDSNGSIIFNGGETYISLTGSGTNLALDYGSENDGSLVINGGIIVACGGSSMYEGVSEKSSQASISYGFDSTVSSSSDLKLLDSDGNELLAWSVPNDFVLSTISCPELAVGDTYTIVAGDTTQEITLDSLVYSNVESIGFGGPGNSGGFHPDNFDGNMPEGFDPNNKPEDFDPSNIPDEFDKNNSPKGFGEHGKFDESSDKSENE